MSSKTVWLKAESTFGTHEEAKDLSAFAAEVDEARIRLHRPTLERREFCLLGTFLLSESCIMMQREER